MSVKEIKEAMKQGRVYFGIRQALKSAKKLSDVFITKDTQDKTVGRLDAAGVEFVVLKSKADIAKELNLDFECEVFSIVSKGVNSVNVKK